MKLHKNWAGNLEYRAKNLFQPESTEQIQEIVRKSIRVKTLGSRHCFNGIADCDQTHLSLALMNRMLAIDESEFTVTIEGGAQYSDFCSELHSAGFALHNLASLANISVVGACATATHGSGLKYQSLAGAVSEVEFVDGEGNLVTLTRRNEPEKFYGAVVNLGAIGIVTKLKLDVEKTHLVRQDLFENLSIEKLAENFDEIVQSGDSISLFTNFQNKNIRVINIKRRVSETTSDLPKEFFGATAASQNINSRGIPDETRSPQMGAPNAWFECLPHFRFSKELVRASEIQSEYYVELKNAVEAILALEKINDMLSPQIITAEIRIVKEDEHWLSPFYRGDSVGIHFSWKINEPEVMKILPFIEETLAPYTPLPHWGKLFTIPRESLHSLYPKMKNFILLANEYDPNRKFRNEFLETYIF